MAQALDTPATFGFDCARLLELITVELGQKLRIVIITIVNVLIYNVVLVGLPFAFEQVLGLAGALRLFPRPQLADVSEKLLVPILTVLNIFVLIGEEFAVTGITLQ